MTLRNRFISLGLVALTLLSLVGCGAFADKFEQAFDGIAATMTTYNQQGKMVDEIKGNSFRVSRDEEFDTQNSDGGSNKDSSVLLISLGDAHIQHVGSSMILVQDGLIDVTAQLPAEARFANTDSGTPWINDIRYRFQQLWGGTAKTIMVRSQDGTPIKVFAGNEVQVLATTVPKSTWFRIDGKTLFVYRSDYTLYDDTLLPRQ